MFFKSSFCLNRFRLMPKSASSGVVRQISLISVLNYSKCSSSLIIYKLRASIPSLSSLTCIISNFVSRIRTVLPTLRIVALNRTPTSNFQLRRSILPNPKINACQFGLYRRSKNCARYPACYLI